MKLHLKYIEFPWVWFNWFCWMYACSCVQVLEYICSYGDQSSTSDVILCTHLICLFVLWGNISHFPVFITSTFYYYIWHWMKLFYLFQYLFWVPKSELLILKSDLHALLKYLKWIMMSAVWRNFRCFLVSPWKTIHDPF